MKAKRESLKDNTYKSKDLCVGYQVLMLRSQNETQKALLSPANPSVLLEARHDLMGLHSSLEIQLGENMSLELHQKGALEVPALLNGKPLSRDTEVRYLDHGSVLQLGSEIIKFKRVETHLGAKGASTQRVYSSERRGISRKAALNQWILTQGLWMLAMVATAILFAVIRQ